MFTNFSDFNFEVIDVLVNNITPELTINKNTVTLSWKLLEELGNPQFLRPLVDFQNKAFALRVCKESDSKIFRVRDAQEKNNKSRVVPYVVIRKTLRDLMRETWNDDKRYRLVGTVFPKEKVAVFDLTQAEELDGRCKKAPVKPNAI